MRLFPALKGVIHPLTYRDVDLFNAIAVIATVRALRFLMITEEVPSVLQLLLLRGR